MAAPSYTYTLTNGTTADATQVMQNFTDALNGITDGTKDLTFNALTANGTANLKSAVILGLSSSNDLTVNGSLATNLGLKTNNSFAVGSAAKGLSGLYLGNSGLGSTCQIVAASHAATQNYSVPDCGTAANFLMSQGTQTAAGAMTFSANIVLGGLVDNSSGTGLKLPTSGGTAGTLAAYEEATISATFSGPFAASQTVNITVRQIGKIVVLDVPQISASPTVSGGVQVATTSTNLLPSRFRPAADLQMNAPVPISNGGNPSSYSAYVLVEASTGRIQIVFTSAAWSTSGGNNGWYHFTVSYAL